MVQSSHVAIAIYLTLCAVLLRCPAMCLLGGWYELRWIAGGMCDPVLEGFVNKTLRSTGEVASDATLRSTNWTVGARAVNEVYVGTLDPI